MLYQFFSITGSEHSWQTLNLFLDLVEYQTYFSFITDDVVGLLHLCSHFMVTERFINWLFVLAFAEDVLSEYERHHIVEIIYVLKECGYLSVARNIVRNASRVCNGIFNFNDLLDSHTLLDY